jgi:hypothetical protein
MKTNGLVSTIEEAALELEKPKKRPTGLLTLL